MARKQNPLLGRLNLLTTWPSLWHSSINYSDLVHQDLFIRKYLKSQLWLYRFKLYRCVIKRSLSSVFLDLSVFNVNQKPSFQFYRPFFLLNPYLIQNLFNLEISRFQLTLIKLSGVSTVRFCLRFIKPIRSNLKTILLLANPILIAFFFMVRYTRMNSYKYIFKNFSRTFAFLYTTIFDLKGLRVKVSGPLKAPRDRRARVKSKFFFSDIPTTSLSEYVGYSVQSRVLSEGTVTGKFWVVREIDTIKLPTISLIESIFSLVRQYRYIYKFPYLNKRFRGLRLWSRYNLKYTRVYKLRPFFIPRRQQFKKSFKKKRMWRNRKTHMI